ncbi:hypothetical protein ACFE04_008034 [Oxalis oulophora]
MDLPLVITVILLLVISKLIHKFIWKPLKIQSHFKSQGIFGPGYRSIFGNSSVIRKMYTEALAKKLDADDHDVLHKVAPFYHTWSTMYGKTFLYWFGTKPRIATSDPEIIKQVAMNTCGCFGKVGFNALSKVLFGEGLVGLVGDKWSMHRRIANQAFNMEPVKNRYERVGR